MEFKDVLAISGKPGLFQYISQGRNGIIVESLVDKKRMNASASMKVSSLEDIAIFTDEGEVSLAEIFLKIKEKESNNQTSTTHKAPVGELVAYFEEILPTYDRDRVYTSDIKKVISWYNLMQQLELLDIVQIPNDEEEAESEEKKEDDNKSSEEE